MKLILTVGISASGKSTWAKEQAQRTGALIACRDDLRFMLTGANGWPEYKYPFDSKVETLVTNLQEEIVIAGEHNNKDVILADTNLNPYLRDAWIKFCKRWSIPTEIKEFHISFQEALKRDSSRGNFSVGGDVIHRQWNQWQHYLNNKETNG